MSGNKGTLPCNSCCEEMKQQHRQNELLHPVNITGTGRQGQGRCCHSSPVLCQYRTVAHRFVAGLLVFVHAVLAPGQVVAGGHQLLHCHIRQGSRSKQCSAAQASCPIPLHKILHLHSADSDTCTCAHTLAQVLTPPAPQRRWRSCHHNPAVYSYTCVDTFCTPQPRLGSPKRRPLSPKPCNPKNAPPARRAAPGRTRAWGAGGGSRAQSLTLPAHTGALATAFLLCSYTFAAC